MSRWVARVLALFVGLVAGTIVAAALARVPIEPAVTPAVAVPPPRPITSTVATTTTETPQPASTTTTLAPEPAATTYLIWASGGMGDDFVAAVRDVLPKAALVAGNLVKLGTDRAEWWIPLDAIAIDPDEHAFHDPEGSLRSLVPGTIALSSSSAGLRGVSVGDALEIGGQFYIVSVIVDDTLVGAAEVVFHIRDVDSGVGTPRYFLVASEEPRQDLEQAVRSLYEGAAPLRIRAEGETPWLRHGDAVLPQVFIKRALGEFAIRELAGSRFEQDAAWVEENLVTVDVRLLGEIRCHRTTIEMINGALADLERMGLAHVIDTGGFAGCWEPRLIRSRTGASAAVSRHAWGAALDMNAATNSVGSSGSQDSRLIAVMRQSGFTWGGEWLVPDPMHFEFLEDVTG